MDCEADGRGGNGGDRGGVDGGAGKERDVSAYIIALVGSMFHAG